MLLLPKKIGSFTLTRKLGSGGVAESYAGMNDASGGRPVVVRRILPYILRDPSRLASIEARAQDLLGVRHPFLVHVTDHVREGEEHFIVEEYVDGINLDKVLAWCRQNQRQLPHNVFLNIATQVCNGLEALHGRTGKGSSAEHVLHLALKPGAIFITREGKVMVGSFGLTRSPTTLPHGGVTGPVPARMEYLSPEQTHPDQKLTPASDIFALGAILYELLTMESLFRADSNLQTIHKVRRAEVTSQLLRAKELMPGLDKVLYRALSLNPRHRYQRAFVLREDLRGLMAGYSFATIAEDTRTFVLPLLDQLGPPPSTSALRAAPDAPADVDSFEDGGNTRIDADPMNTAQLTAQALQQRAAAERAGGRGASLVSVDDMNDNSESTESFSAREADPPTVLGNDRPAPPAEEHDRPTIPGTDRADMVAAALGGPAPVPFGAQARGAAALPPIDLERSGEAVAEPTAFDAMAPESEPALPPASSLPPVAATMAAAAAAGLAASARSEPSSTAQFIAGEAPAKPVPPPGAPARPAGNPASTAAFLYTGPDADRSADPVAPTHLSGAKPPPPPGSAAPLPPPRPATPVSVSATTGSALPGPTVAPPPSRPPPRTAAPGTTSQPFPKPLPPPAVSPPSAPPRPASQAQASPPPASNSAATAAAPMSPVRPAPPTLQPAPVAQSASTPGSAPVAPPKPPPPAAPRPTALRAAPPVPPPAPDPFEEPPRRSSSMLLFGVAAVGAMGLVFVCAGASMGGMAWWSNRTEPVASVDASAADNADILAGAAPAPLEPLNPDADAANVLAGGGSTPPGDAPEAGAPASAPVAAADSPTSPPPSQAPTASGSTAGGAASASTSSGSGSSGSAALTASASPARTSSPTTTSTGSSSSGTTTTASRTTTKTTEPTREVSWDAPAPTRTTTRTTEPAYVAAAQPTYTTTKSAPTTTTTTSKTSRTAAPVEPEVAAPAPAADMSIAEAPVSELDQYVDAAKKGKLDSSAVASLEGIPAQDPQYTRSRALLSMNAQRKGDASGQKRYLDQIMQVPENQYNPVYLTDYARWSVNNGDYSTALDKAQLAERYWSRLPPELVFTKKAEIYEIEATAWQGKFYKSQEDVDLLDKAIHNWERYKEHVTTRSRDDLEKRADAQIAKLNDIRQRLQ